MKKLCLIFLFISMAFASCDFSMPRLTEGNPVDSIQIQRYDRVESRYLTTGDFAALQEMNTVYPTETRALIEDLLKLGSVYEEDINKKLLDFYQDTTLQNVIYAAETEYADMTELNAQMKSAFKKLKKELPNLEIPTFYAQIGAFDQSIVVDDKAIGISLDKYLGANYAPYERFYDASQRKTMTRDYIVPDCIVFYLLSQYPLDDFEEHPQYERDIHLSKLFWVANYVTGKDLMKTAYTQKINLYMREHKDLTTEGLLQLKDDFKF